jgi:hypothetical protein
MEAVMEFWLSRKQIIELAIEKAMETFDEAEEVVIAARERDVDREALTTRFYCCEEHKQTLGTLFEMLWPPEES